MKRVRHTQTPSGRCCIRQIRIIKEAIRQFRKSWHHVLDCCGSIRFVGGDYGYQARIRAEAQAWFLDALRCVHSSPTKWLLEHVWPPYLAALGQLTEDYDLGLQDERRARFKREVTELDLHNDAARSNSSLTDRPPAEAEELRQAAARLIEWSHRFNLRGRVPDNAADVIHEPAQSWSLSSWPMRAAEETLWSWYTSPDRETLLREASPRWQRYAEQTAGGVWLEFLNPIQLKQPVFRAEPDCRVANPPEVSYEMNLLAWYVERESEKMFRARAREAFETWLDNFVDDRLQKATANGMTRAPEKRELDHFVWLALYQVERISASVIAVACNVSVDAVKDALERTAGLIGLAMRPGRRGRPRKKMGD